MLSEGKSADIWHIVVMDEVHGAEARLSAGVPSW